MKTKRLPVITSVLSILLAINGLFMLLCLPVAIYHAGGPHGGGLFELLIPGAILTFGGGALWWFTRAKNIVQLNKREGYLIVTLGWILMALSGAIPYALLGSPHFNDFSAAFFESMSGFTTTGASILDDIEQVPYAILLWRSITHWIGGMGIIVLTVAVLPLLGIGGMQLFAAESPGPTPDKLHPRITDTAKRLWLIYVGMTVIEALLLWAGEMDLFEAVNHAFATVSTGGFSTKNASVAAYGAYSQYVIILFMFLSGINFSLTYFALKGRIRTIWRNDEFRVFLLGSILLTLICSVVVYNVTPASVEQSFRDSLFQVLAVVTTTGFVTADFTQWAHVLTVMFFLLMFVGASSGSTSGGVKIIRHLIIIKNGLIEFKRLLHPSAIIPLRLNRKSVSQQIALNVLGFFIIYMWIFALGALVLGVTGYDFVTAIGATATSLGNVGPGLGEVDPSSNFAGFGAFQKYFLSFLMLLGRLELFTVLILFTPYFWRNT